MWLDFISNQFKGVLFFGKHLKGRGNLDFNFKRIIQLCVFILWGCFCQIKVHVYVAFCITYHTVCEKRGWRE